MSAKRLWVVALAAGLLALPTASAGPPEIFPLSQVKRGQTGYGLTTIKGTEPERFEFEVIGVNRNFLPKMDIILVKSEDPKLEVTGFWQGMSGSPLFIEGKLACAFSYGFRFNKVAIGGCTPIHYMQKEGFKTPRYLDAERMPRKPLSASKSSSSRRSVVPPAVASMDEWKQVAPAGDVQSAFDRLGPARTPWLMNAPLPPAPASPIDDSENGMVAASVPMAVSGFSGPAFDQAKQIMSRYPLEPMRAGGTGNPNEGPEHFQLGGSIAVQLLRGDMSAAATGTVSYVDGNRVLAFGHPLFQAGELYAPVASAEVHTVIPSAMSAFVVASPARELGSLVQDRQSTIMANTELSTRMVPVDIFIESGNGKDAQKGEFHVEVLDNRFFTGALAGMVAMNAVSHYLPDQDHATVLVESAVHLKGHKPLYFTDYLYAADGVSSVIGGARGLRVLVPLLMNPFSPVEIERVELRASIKYEVNYGDIKRLRLPASELKPGKRTYVDVEMTTYDGQRITRQVPFDVPANLAGSIVRLEVTAGDSAKLDVAPPTNIDQLLAAFRKLLPGNVFAVTLYTADEGVAVDGKLVHDLPASALDRLHPGSTTQRAGVYHAVARSIAPADRVINGSMTTLIKIADE